MKDPIMDMKLKCICCSNDLVNVGEKNKFSLWQCFACDFLTVYPKPSKNDLADIYTDQYFIKEKSKSISNKLGYIDILSSSYAENNRIISNVRLKIIEKIISKRDWILDVGCGAGVFLEVAKAHGWKTAGVEINPKMNGLSSVNCSESRMFSSTDEVNGSYSVITMWEYLEHVIDPVSEMGYIKNKIAADGLLCLSFPNIESKSQASRIKWEQVKPPDHLNYWTENSVRLFLEKNDFQVVGFRYHGNKFHIQGVKVFGSRQNKETIVWPLMSLFNKLISPCYATKFRSSFPSVVRKLYEGIEVYAIYKGK